MRAELELEVKHPEKVHGAVSPDLVSSERVVFGSGFGDAFNVSVEADSLGALRGALNTVMKLTKLSSKIGDFCAE